jgi:hypothetical protein
MRKPEPNKNQQQLCFFTSYKTHLGALFGGTRDEKVVNTCKQAINEYHLNAIHSI